jgi:hypothetical protein
VASATKIATPIHARMNSASVKPFSRVINTKKKIPENTRIVPRWKPTDSANR